MDKLIVKLFGVNRMNFYGWLFAGLLIIFVALACVALAFSGFPRPELFLLTAICVLLLGIFGLQLQTYCALLAEKLDPATKPPPEVVRLPADEPALRREPPVGVQSR